MSPRLEMIGGLIMLVATLVYAIEPERVVISGDDAVPVRIAPPPVPRLSPLSYAATSSHMMPVYTPCVSTTAGAVNSSGTLCTTMVPVSR